MKKEYVTLKLAEIIPYENNPRLNDEAVEYVAESIKQCGYISPIVIDEDNIILCGHTRLKALEQLGKAEAEVMKVTGLTEEQKKKYRLLDNKTNEFADWDFDLLASELEDLDFEGFDFGFDIDEIEGIEEIGRKGNMAQKFLIPPFSVIQGNKGDWLSRKKKWIDFGIRSEVGRAGNLLSIEGAIERQTSYTIGGAERAKAFKNNEKLNSYMRK